MGITPVRVQVPLAAQDNGGCQKSGLPITIGMVCNDFLTSPIFLNFFLAILPPCSYNPVEAILLWGAMKIILAPIAIALATYCSCKYPEKFNPLIQPMGPELRGIEIILSAATMFEQETAQATALVILANGKKRPAENVAWESLDAQILAIDQSGMITGLMPGTSGICARLYDMYATSAIEVRPKIDYSGIMISEVFYDPEGSDDGMEFIEIYNDNEYPCDISGMMTVDGSAASKPFVFPADSLINAKTCIVIAQSRDGFYSLFGSYPDFSDLPFTLNNSGETVVLTKSDGTIIDAVFIKGGTEDFRPYASWGSNSLPAAPTGSSVYRVNAQNTGTYIDWTAGAPSPGRL